MEGKSILVVDDDKNICELLKLYLSNAGYNVYICHDGAAALDIIKDHMPDLIVLDLMLPVVNGWDVCRSIRQTSSVPVIMLTARDMLDDKIKGFEIGADDYVVKPFQPKELLARIKARLRDDRQNQNKAEGVLKLGDLVVDINKYEVTIEGRTIDLKPKEVQLLYFLLNNKNIVFSREQLLDKVWNYEFMVDTRTVDVHIKRLREKLAKSNASWRIKTVWGVGYKLEVK